MTKPRKRKRKADDQVFDFMTEEEIPEYQQTLQEFLIAVDLDETLAEKARGLPPSAIKLAYVTLNPRIKRTVTEFCKVAGCTRATYYAVEKNPKFVEFRNYLGRRFTEDDFAEAIVALRDLIKMRDAKGVRLFFELRGDLVQKVETTNVTETHEERMKRIRLQEAARKLREGHQVETPTKPPSGAPDHLPLPDESLGDDEPDRLEISEERLERARLFPEDDQEDM